MKDFFESFNGSEVEKVIHNCADYIRKNIKDSETFLHNNDEIYDVRIDGSGKQFTIVYTFLYDLDQIDFDDSDEKEMKSLYSKIEKESIKYITKELKSVDTRQCKVSKVDFDNYGCLEIYFEVK